MMMKKSKDRNDRKKGDAQFEREDRIYIRWLFNQIMISFMKMETSKNGKAT